MGFWGTTWTEKILACFLEGTSAAETIDVEARFPFIEFTQPELPDLPAYDGLALAQAQARPRFLKTHLPAPLLPDIAGKGAKIVLIIRDPKDTLVSHFHFYRNMEWVQYNGSLDAMLDAFVSDQHVYGGYFNWYSGWAKHLESSPLAKVHFLSYEKLKHNFSEEIASLAMFLGKNLSAEQIAKITRVNIWYF